MEDRWIIEVGWKKNEEGGAMVGGGGLAVVAGTRHPGLEAEESIWR